eukprot:jgi/Mesvir1/22608/Mv14054-RA.2
MPDYDDQLSPRTEQLLAAARGRPPHAMSMPPAGSLSPVHEYPDSFREDRPASQAGSPAMGARDKTRSNGMNGSLTPALRTYGDGTKGRAGANAAGNGAATPVAQVPSMGADGSTPPERKLEREPSPPMLFFEEELAAGAAAVPGGSSGAFGMIGAVSLYNNAVYGIADAGSHVTANGAGAMVSAPAMQQQAWPAVNGHPHDASASSNWAIVPYGNGPQLSPATQYYSGGMGAAVLEGPQYPHWRPQPSIVVASRDMATFFDNMQHGARHGGLPLALPGAGHGVAHGINYGAGHGGHPMGVAWGSSMSIGHHANVPGFMPQAQGSSLMPASSTLLGNVHAGASLPLALARASSSHAPAGSTATAANPAWVSFGEEESEDSSSQSQSSHKLGAPTVATSVAGAQANLEAGKVSLPRALLQIDTLGVSGTPVVTVSRNSTPPRPGTGGTGAGGSADGSMREVWTGKGFSLTNAGLPGLDLAPKSPKRAPMAWPKAEPVAGYH